MKAEDVLEYFLSRADWVDRKTTVDRIIAGDPHGDFDRCVVTWIPSMNALRWMAERAIGLLVCHEPTFWNHRDDRPIADDRVGREKLDFIRDHDCWDRWPEVGIPWAWAQFLGLADRPEAIGAAGYQHRYDIAPIPLEDFARQVAGRCADVGEPLVQVT